MPNNMQHNSPANEQLLKHARVYFALSLFLSTIGNGFIPESLRQAEW
jgi:hypothetical protein